MAKSILESDSECNAVRYSESSKSVKCKECQKEFTEKKYLNAHMKTHAIIKCEECEEAFKNKKAFNAHVRMHKKSLQSLHCEVCNREFKPKPT